MHKRKDWERVFRKSMGSVLIFMSTDNLIFFFFIKFSMVFCAPRPIMGAQCVQLSHDPDKSVGSNTTRSQESVSDCSIVYMSSTLSSQSVGALSVKVSMSHNDRLIHVILPFSQLNEPALVEGLVLINVDPCAKGWIDWAASKVTFWTHGQLNVCILCRKLLNS